jgi:hypothetical protein
MSTRSKIAVVASPVAVLVLALALAGCGTAGPQMQSRPRRRHREVPSSVSTVSGTAVDFSTRQPLTGVDIAFYKLPEADGTPMCTRRPTHLVATAST